MCGGVNRQMKENRFLLTKGRVLVVQLGRFDERGGGKRTTEIFVEEVIRFDGIAFRLSSVIHHIGKTIHSGHYVTHSLQADGEWVVCNDGSVGPSSLAAARATLHNSQPYVLVYK